MTYAVPVNGNRMTYGGYLMRSNLEVNLAVTLDAHRVTWQYEAEAITLPDGRRYHPDFTITEDPLDVTDGANLIEVKDRKHVWRCAETLGLGDAGEEHKKGWRWTPPRPIREHDLSGDYWATLSKPIQAALTGRRVLIVGASSNNAAVILLGGNGLMSAKRHHKLMSLIYRQITVEGQAWAPSEDIHEATTRLNNWDALGWQPLRDGISGTYVSHAWMSFPLHRIRELLHVAQETPSEEEVL